MAGPKANEGAAQGAAPIENQAGIQSEIEVGAKPAEQPAEQPAQAETPEWVQAILDSNAAVISINQVVISGLESFKQHAADFVQNIADGGQSVNEIEPPKQADFDEDADYEVAPGKSFADKDDITKKYSSGDDVSHFDADRLKSLLTLGLIIPID
jgi:hypothetical protein